MKSNRKRRKVIVLMRPYAHPDDMMVVGIMRYFNEHAADRHVVIMEPDAVTDTTLADCDGLVFRSAMIPPVRSLCGKVPMVAIDMPPDAALDGMPGLVSVNFDNVSIGKTGAEHLFSHGVSGSYAYIPSPNGSHWSDPRQEGFVSEIRRRGGDVRVYDAAKDGSLVDFFSRLPLPTAVMASCDAEALRVLTALHDAGLEIPDDAMLLGVDNEGLLPVMMQPTLTSVAADHETEGYRAAEALDRAMSGKRLATTDIRVKPGRVTERETTSRRPSSSAS